MKMVSSIKNALEKPEPLFSVEFFPPKNEEGGKRMLETAAAIQPYKPDFVSITYGAGGGTRETTMHYARALQDEYNFEVMPHLTCVGHTSDELLASGINVNLPALSSNPKKPTLAAEPVWYLNSIPLSLLSSEPATM